MITKEDGRNFTQGFFLEVAWVILLGALVVGIGQAALNTLNIGVDDTDRNGWNRSGLRIYTDHKTGIQYLSDGRGGLIPRGVIQLKLEEKK